MSAERTDKRTRFRMFGAMRICYLDFTNVTDETEALAGIEEARQVIAKEPPKSVYTLTDVSSSLMTPRIRKALQELTAQNKPFVVAGAVVGLTAVQRGALRTIVLLTGRKLEVAQSVEAAVAWLTEQKNAARRAP